MTEKELDIETHEEGTGTSTVEKKTPKKKRSLTKLQQAQKDIEELNDKSLRRLAEFENFKKRMLRETARSLIRVEDNALIYGNRRVKAFEKLGYKYPECEFVMTSWWQLARTGLLEITETGFGGTGHAGEFETSLMMLIAPDLIKTDKIAKGENQEGYSWSEADMLHGPEASHFRTMKQLTTNGVFGDPRAASLEKGEQITEVVVKRLLKIVGDLLPE